MNCAPNSSSAETNCCPTRLKLLVFSRRYKLLLEKREELLEIREEVKSDKEICTEYEFILMKLINNKELVYPWDHP